MAKVDVTVNGVNYSITCDDGQEERLRDLAAYFDVHVTRLAATLGNVSDSRLMLLAGLMISDELLDTKARLDAMELETGMTSSDGAAKLIEEAAAKVQALVRD